MSRVVEKTLLVDGVGTAPGASRAVNVAGGMEWGSVAELLPVCQSWSKEVLS